MFYQHSTVWKTNIATLESVSSSEKFCIKFPQQNARHCDNHIGNWHIHFISECIYELSRKYGIGDYSTVLQSEACRELFHIRAEDETNDLETLLQTNLTRHLADVSADDLPEKYVFVFFHLPCKSSVLYIPFVIITLLLQEY